MTISWELQVVVCNPMYNKHPDGSFQINILLENTRLENSPKMYSFLTRMFYKMTYNQMTETWNFLQYNGI